MAAITSIPLRSQQLADALRKRTDTARARAALLGMVFATVEGDDGLPLFVITADRWALTRSFTDMGEVDSWLDRVGGC